MTGHNYSYNPTIYLRLAKVTDFTTVSSTLTSSTPPLHPRTHRRRRTNRPADAPRLRCSRREVRKKIRNMRGRAERPHRLDYNGEAALKEATEDCKAGKWSRKQWPGKSDKIINTASHLLQVTKTWRENVIKPNSDPVRDLCWLLQKRFMILTSS